MWINRRRFCGSPIFKRSSLVRESPGLEPCQTFSCMNCIASSAVKCLASAVVKQSEIIRTRLAGPIIYALLCYPPRWVSAHRRRLPCQMQKSAPARSKIFEASGSRGARQRSAGRLTPFKGCQRRTVAACGLKNGLGLFRFAYCFIVAESRNVCHFIDLHFGLYPYIIVRNAIQM